MTLAILSLILLAACAVLAGDTVRLDSLIRQCSFMVDGIRFDLCPILGQQKEKGGWWLRNERETPPTITYNSYRLSLDGALHRNASIPEDRQCPEGTWICFTQYNRQKGAPWNESRILQTVPVAGILSPEKAPTIVQRGTYSPGVQITAKMAKLWGHDEDSLMVRFDGGYYVDTAQAANIHFHCDHDHENSGLAHMGTYGGTHFFSWKTPHACFDAAEAPPDLPDNEQELIPPPLGNNSGRAYWTLLVSTLCVIAVAAYLVYYPPRPLRRRISLFLKEHPSLLRFRVGEGVLVRWAHEEVLLDNLEGDIVEGDDVNWAREEEQIPLKPSPRKGNIAFYGTTR